MNELARSLIDHPVGASGQAVHGVLAEARSQAELLVMIAEQLAGPDAGVRTVRAILSRGLPNRRNLAVPTGRAGLGRSARSMQELAGADKASACRRC